MKVLWLINDLPGYISNRNFYNGRGWIKSLMNNIIKYNNIELGIAFYVNNKTKPSTNSNNNVIFFPIEENEISNATKLIRRLTNSTYKKKSIEHIEHISNILKKFKPEVIHVWGTESDLGLISLYTKIPVVIHLQGIINPYMNALLPPGFSKCHYVLQNGLRYIIKNLLGYYDWKRKAEIELTIFKECRFYLGRTKWDNSISKLFNNSNIYFHCDEVLRTEFYNDKWVIKDRGCIVLMSTISSPLYKGFDLVLKTAQLLTKNEIKFEWKIFGSNNFNFVEHKLNIKSKENGISFLGVASAIELKNSLLECDLYIHPSYIDNSPNSICEAQILGVPVISTNVGGISSLIEDDKSGILVPANDPHYLAQQIIELVSNKEKMHEISQKSYKIANQRHNPKLIVENLIGIYKKITNEYAC